MPVAKSSTAARQEYELAYDIKFLLVVVFLFLFYPVGLILMWVWMPWPTWLKVVISLPVLLGVFLFFVCTMVFVGMWHRGMENRQMMPYYRNYHGYYQSFPQRRMMLYQNPNANQTLTPTPTPSSGQTPSAGY